MRAVCKHLQNFADAFRVIYVWLVCVFCFVFFHLVFPWQASRDGRNIEDISFVPL